MAKPKITPVGGNILVKPITQDTTTPSGIVLPDTADKEKPQRGEIIALGTQRLSQTGEKIDFTVKVGDVVFFRKYSQKLEEFEVDGEDYLIMDEDAVLAVIG
ncbi:co-chaperone GroES [Candidatus Dojkabacteria bacterium]|uniref:Co-chaperonin GroES n=1 Tax=Candidatus Dojkabacteria bacterium TaxID=2099670 RepID=A0A955L7I6_9BACT|nr:co-chaperone GroES [Candidatus Dojkabacteria bacterium]